MDASQLAWIAQLGRSDSMAGAAGALGVAPSTLYRRLEKLEAQLGLPLFDRRRGSLTPTAAGRAVLEAADDVAERLARLERTLAAQGSRLAGRVVVSAPEALALLLMSPLAALRDAHPELAVALDVSTDRTALERGEADVALRVSAEPGDNLVGRRVGPVAMAVFAHAPVRGPFDPGRHPWVCFDRSLAHTAQGRWEAANVPAERVRMRLSSRTLFLEAVQQGVGVGLVPVALGEARGLHAISPPFEDPTMVLWVLCHPSVRELPTVRVVMDTVLATLGVA